MQYLKQLLSVGLVAAIVLTTIIISTGTASAQSGPSNMDCVSNTIRVGSSTECLYRVPENISAIHSATHGTVTFVEFDYYYGEKYAVVRFTSESPGVAMICARANYISTCDTVTVNP